MDLEQARKDQEEQNSSGGTGGGASALEQMEEAKEDAVFYYRSGADSNTSGDTADTNQCVCIRVQQVHDC